MFCHRFIFALDKNSAAQYSFTGKKPYFSCHNLRFPRLFGLAMTGRPPPTLLFIGEEPAYTAAG